MIICILFIMSFSTFYILIWLILSIFFCLRLSPLILNNRFQLFKAGLSSEYLLKAKARVEQIELNTWLLLQTIEKFKVKWLGKPLSAKPMS